MKFNNTKKKNFYELKEKKSSPLHPSPFPFHYLRTSDVSIRAITPM